MILCISGIKVDTGAPVPDDSKGKQHTNVILEVTDGWYGINAQLDEHLARSLHSYCCVLRLNRLVLLGKLFVGLKIRVFGSQVTGTGHALSPLEACDSTMLSLHMNGTRFYQSL